MCSENATPLTEKDLLDMEGVDSSPYTVEIGEEISSFEHQMTILFLFALANGPKRFHC